MSWLFFSLSFSIPLARSLSYLNKPVATKQILRLISAHFSAFFPFRSPKPFAVGLVRRRLKNNVGRSRFGRQKLTLIERLFFLTSSKTASAFKLFFVPSIFPDKGTSKVAEKRNWQDFLTFPILLFSYLSARWCISREREGNMRLKNRIFWRKLQLTEFPLSLKMSFAPLCNKCKLLTLQNVPFFEPIAYLVARWDVAGHPIGCIKRKRRSIWLFKKTLFPNFHLLWRSCLFCNGLFKQDTCLEPLSKFQD